MKSLEQTILAKSLADELAEFDAHLSPLSGGDVLEILVRHGLLSPTMAQESLDAAYKKLGRLRPLTTKEARK